MGRESWVLSLGKTAIIGCHWRLARQCSFLYPFSHPRIQSREPLLDAPKNLSRAPLRPVNLPTLALTTLGLGFLRPAPGTWGSMPPAALACALVLAGVSPTARDAMLGVVLVVSCLACVVFGRYAETRFGRKDAAEVVVDETAGQCLPLMLLPLERVLAQTGDAGWLVRSLTVAALCGFAFVLFRIFDIVKPWPAKRAEALPHGWGTLADDLIAGLYAALVMQVAMRAW